MSEFFTGKYQDRTISAVKCYAGFWLGLERP